MKLTNKDQGGEDEEVELGIFVDGVAQYESANAVGDDAISGLGLEAFKIIRESKVGGKSILYSPSYKVVRKGVSYEDSQPSDDADEVRENKFKKLSQIQYTAQGDEDAAKNTYGPR